MAKVIEVKFIRVAWNLAPQRGVWRERGKKYGDKYYDKDMHDPPLDNKCEMLTRGLDIAHAELECEIEEHLEQGWTMDGAVTYLNPEKGGDCYTGAGLSHLVQKMVKYETAPSLELGIRRK